MANANKIHLLCETSAKTGENIEKLFAAVARELYIQAKLELEAPPATVTGPPGGGGIKIGVVENNKK